MRDEVAGRLVAGHDEEHEEEVQLGVGQPVTVDLRVDEDRHDVVAWVLPPIGRQLVAQRVELGRREHAVFVHVWKSGSCAPTRRFASDGRTMTVALRDADHLADGLHR